MVCSLNPPLDETLLDGSLRIYLTSCLLAVSYSPGSSLFSSSYNQSLFLLRSMASFGNPTLDEALLDGSLRISFTWCLLVGCYNLGS